MLRPASTCPARAILPVVLAPLALVMLGRAKVVLRTHISGSKDLALVAVVREARDRVARY
jgi:hypothetical protein